MPTAISYGGTSSGTTTSDISITPPSGLAEGDLLVFAALTNGGGGSTAIGTPPSGLTELYSSVDTNARARYIWWKIAGASEPSTYDWSGASTWTKHFSCSRFSNVSSLNPIPVFDHVSGNSVSLQAPDVTVTVDESIAMRVVFVDDNTSSTADSGLTTLATHSNTSGSDTHLLVGWEPTPYSSGDSTGLKGWTSSTAEIYKAVTLLISPSISTGGGGGGGGSNSLHPLRSTR